MAVSYQIRDGVAILGLDNPPVNGLGIDMRRDLVDALDRAVNDDGVVGVVVTGNARTFSGGADIREFNTPQMWAEPSLATVIAAFEASAKPTVAAIEGLALGGGLEFALGMHHRVADAKALVGLPEVKIGLLPGAGGTQRLPRAVGLETAANMIVSGNPVAAGKLAATKLFDEVVEGSAVDAAVALCRKVAASGGPHPRVRDWKVEHPNAEGFLAFARTGVAAASKNLPAPFKCLDAIEAAVKRGFDQGIKAERDGFMHLLETPESKALRHAFFSERAAGKIDGIDASTPLREIRKVGIVGAGTMGGGIAMNFLNAGIPVILLEMKQEALDRGIATIRGNYEASAKKGRFTAEQVEATMALLATTLDYADLGDADLIVEAVFEELSVKETVFKKLDEVAKPGAILASNTSTLDVDKIAQFTKRPQDVIGMHFFSPANVMKLLEIVRGKATAPDVLATVMALAKKIGKIGVVVGVCDGFVGNRMVEEYLRQAYFLLDEGALPQQVDKAIEAFGFAMGPFRMMDLAGNDIGWAIRKRRLVERPQMKYSKVPDLLCEAGRYGQKTGAGWYDYKPGDRTAYPSAIVDEMIEKHSAELGVRRRVIGDEEIVQRLLYALANEGALILQEGIAAKASDIDVVYLAGYGFPAFRGGPMFHADQTGLYNVLRSMRGFARGYEGDNWTPAPLLVELAESGRTFNS